VITLTLTNNLQHNTLQLLHPQARCTPTHSNMIVAAAAAAVAVPI
jgi:hypothetical protein